MSSQDTTFAQVKAALIAKVKLLKTANGYATSIPDANVHPSYSSAVVKLSQDIHYPKAFVLMFEGRSDQRVGGFQSRTNKFLLVFVFKKTATHTEEPQIQCEKAIEDVENLLARDPSLGGLVENAQVTEFSTDGGATYPEGVCEFLVEVERLSRRL